MSSTPPNDERTPESIIVLPEDERKLDTHQLVVRTRVEMKQLREDQVRIDHERRNRERERLQQEQKRRETYEAAERKRERDFKEAEKLRDSKVDGQMTDVRTTLEKLRAKDADLDKANEQILVLHAADFDTATEVKALKENFGELRDMVGKPPQKLEARASQSGDSTPEELTELEQGTGLAGVVGRLVAGQKRLEENLRKHTEARLQRLERRVGVAAVLGAVATSSPSWAPHAVELLSKVFGG